MSRWLLRGLGSICGLLGLASCVTDDVVTEYGCPSATWTLKGTVQDSASGSALAGLLLTVQDTASGCLPDSARSSATGAYSVTERHFDTDHTVRLRVSDSSGTYQAKDTLIRLSTQELSGGDGHWDMGSAVRTVAMKLSRKP